MPYFGPLSINLFNILSPARLSPPRLNPPLFTPDIVLQLRLTTSIRPVPILLRLGPLRLKPPRST